MIWLALAAIAAAFIGGIVLGRRTVVTGAPTDASANAAAVEVLPAADDAALAAEAEARKKADAALHATDAETRASVERLRAMGRNGNKSLPVLLVLALTRCAVAPASLPSPPASLPGDCLDLEGQRELLAGVEVLFGEASAKLARCQIERGALMRWGQQEAARADDAERRAVWLSIVTTVLGAAVAAALTAGIEAATNGHRTTPATPATPAVTR